jgi:uncharacterized repeat protein (TIGR04052 family)
MHHRLRLLAFACTFALLASPAAQAQTTASPSEICTGDANLDTEVTVDEIVTTVDNALAGCDYVPVTIAFSAMVGDEPFICGNSYEGIGLGATTMTPSDFRFYVHNVRLLDDSGREVPVLLDQDGIWQLEDLALLDFEDKTAPCNIGTVQTNTTLRGMVPRGSYDGIRFTLGVPFRMNHQDASIAPSPLVLTSMFWNWQGGYKFVRIDDATDQVRIHLGSTGCTTDAPNSVIGCARPNLGEVYLPAFDPATDTIVADLAAVLADNDISVNQPETPPGCMAGPTDSDCGPMLQNLGVNFANGLPDPSRQTFFQVR